MIVLSEEPMDENIGLCLDYLKRMTKMGMLLEMELGITGGEEDGVNNEVRVRVRLNDEVRVRVRLRSP